MANVILQLPQPQIPVEILRNGFLDLPSELFWGNKWLFFLDFSSYAVILSSLYDGHYTVFTYARAQVLEKGAHSRFGVPDQNGAFSHFFVVSHFFCS